MTDGLFHCWYTLTNFENNKAVAPVDFEFFLYGMLVLYILHYCTLILFLPSDSFLVHHDLNRVNDFIMNNLIQWKYWISFRIEL